MLMQCPGAHTQVLPRCRTSSKRLLPGREPAVLPAVPPGAGFSRAPAAEPRRHSADLRPRRAEARGGESSGRCRGLSSSAGFWADSPPPYARRCQTGAGGGSASGVPRSGPGPGGGRRVRVRAPSRPGSRGHSRQRRQPARASSARRRQPVRKVRTNGCFPLLSFPPALTGEGPVAARRKAGGPTEKLGEDAAPDQDALASVCLGPCHLSGRSRGPAARRVPCPEPRVYGVLLCPPREKITPLRRDQGLPSAPRPSWRACSSPVSSPNASRAPGSYVFLGEA